MPNPTEDPVRQWMESLGYKYTDQTAGLTHDPMWMHDMYPPFFNEQATFFYDVCRRVALDTRKDLLTKLHRFDGKDYDTAIDEEIDRLLDQIDAQQ